MEPRIGGQSLAQCHHCFIFAVVRDVIHDQQPARTQQVHQAVEHVLVAVLIAVLEDEIERPGNLVQKTGGVAHHHADAMLVACRDESRARLAGEGRIHLHRDHHAIRGQGRRQVQGRISVAGADFQYAACPAPQRQRLEHGSDVGERHPTILTWPTTPR